MDTGSAALQAAYNALHERVTEVGTQQQIALLQQVSQTVIRDKLVFPKSMVFRPGTDVGMHLVYFPDNGPSETVVIHPHALGQMADKSRPSKDEPGMHRRYMWELYSGDYWHRELLSHSMNCFYQMAHFVDKRKNPAKFLHRLVGDQLCGFLSRSFNRNLNTLSSLKAFVEACGLHGAVPVSAGTTLVRTYLRCVLPTVFEPIPGEFIAFGVAYGNSDFGDGTLNISNVLMRLNAASISKAKYGSSMVTESSYSKTHLGSIIKESDIELSDETARKEVIAVNSAIADAVKQQLNQESVDKMLDAIRLAHQERLPWNTVQELLTAVIGKKNAEAASQFLTMGVEDLPPPPIGNDGSPEASGWWLSNLLGWYAEHEPDQARKVELQNKAGEVLSKAAKGKI
jgi:hypothetical protein